MPLSGKNKHTSDPVIETRDFFKSGEPFSLVWDQELKLLKTDPVPALDKLSDYYDSEQYISHVDSRNGFMPSVYRWVRRYMLKRKLNLLVRLNRDKGSLLDIGAGTGAFLEAADRRGWEALGVEPSVIARQTAQEKGLSVVGAIEDVNASKKFNVITLWHVLEHLPDLAGTIIKLKSMLSPEGYLIIAVPNYKSYDAKHYKHFWAAYDVPRHLWHFSRETLPPLFGPELKCRAIKPMFFDAFYVSLLSEKYKTGHLFSLRAILIGLLSNLKALRSGEYSSLIFVFSNAN